MEKYRAAIDIGGSKITASLAGREGFRIRVYQPVKLEGDEKTIPKQVDSLIGYGCERLGVKKEKSVEAVGISTCSPFRKKDGYLVVAAENLCGGINEDIPNDWTGIPLEEELAGIYREVMAMNDCTAAAVAEKLFGAARKSDDFVYIGWGTGIGMGAYASSTDEKGRKSSRLFVGKDGNSLEGGHVTIADGPLCGCGGYGHLEALASGMAIERDYGQKAEYAFRAYREGDKKAMEVIRTAADNFAKGLSTLNSIFDNDLFVIGGSVFMDNQRILLPMVKESFYQKYRYPVLSKGVAIKPTALGRYLGDMAGLSLVMPDEWVGEWQERKPWKRKIETVVLD